MKKNNKEYLALSSLVAVTLVSGAILGSSRSFADDSTVDDISITVPVSCTLSATGTDSHTATIPNGIYSATYTDSDSGVDYTNGIGTTTLKAYCNDNNGFAIYAAGYTGNEIGGENSNKLVGTPSGIGNIITGTATNGTTSNWSMKLTATTGTYTPIIAGSTNDTEKETGDPDFSNYTAVPNEYTKVAYRTSATDIGQNAEGSILTTTYAAYISPTQPAGTYTGQVIYTLVHPYTHLAPVACNPNATTISQVKCMQDFASLTTANRASVLNSMTPETQYTLKDSRDGKEYTIAKLADGNVWMTKNLDLDLDSGTTYTNLDTDLGYNTSTGTYDTASWTPIRSTYATTNNQTHEWCAGGTWNSQYGYCESNYTPESYDPGDLYWNGVESDYNDWDQYYQSCDWSTSTPVCDQSLNPISTYTSSTGIAQYHLGNYYNWNAAVAMNNTSELTTNGTLVEQSICPAGWTLPRAGSGEDTFYALWDEYGFTNGSFIDTNSNYQHDSNENALWTSPLYFAAGGYFGGYLGDVGGVGGFWSPVVNGNNNAWVADFGMDGDVLPSDYGSRGVGNSVRCIARPVELYLLISL